MRRQSHVIFIINPTLGLGGVERKIADIALYIARAAEFQSASVYLILDASRPPAASTAVFARMVGKSRITICYRPANVPFALHLWWQALRLHPAVMLVFSRRLILLAIALRALLWQRGLRVIVGNDTLASHALETYVPRGVRRAALKQLMRLLYPRADLLIAPSEHSGRDLVEHFAVARERIVVNKNWTRTEGLPARSPARFDLIFVGRIERVKNLTLLVEIVRQVRAAIPALRVCIVGDGDELAQIVALAAGQGLDETVCFVGAQSNVGEYLAAARVFVLTSTFEGLPIAGLEAMAHGLPVVTTAYPGAAELVQDSETGYVCANVVEYVARVVQLLNDEPLRLVMGARACVLVRARHNEQNLKEFAALLLPQPPFVAATQNPPHNVEIAG